MFWKMEEDKVDEIGGLRYVMELITAILVESMEFVSNLIGWLIYFVIVNYVRMCFDNYAWMCIIRSSICHRFGIDERTFDFVFERDRGIE